MTKEDDFLKRLQETIEDMDPSNYAETLFRDRPYDGQPWTDQGIRGKQEVKGLTMRDVRDCYIRGCYESSGWPREQWPRSIYDLPWDRIDPMAVIQNTLCEIEKFMGIFPNVPKDINVWDHIPTLSLDEEDGDPNA